MLNRFFQLASASMAIVIATASISMGSTLTIPSKGSFSPDEYQSIKHYHKSFIGKYDCKQSKVTSVEDKKSYLLTCMGNNHPGLNKYLKLSNSFWNHFNVNQILFLASMHGVYPNLDANKDKPVEVLDKKTGYYTIKSDENSDMDNFDCIRTNVALASLAKSSTYAGLKNEGLYTRQKNIGLYTELLKAFPDVFKVQLSNFTSIGFTPVVNVVTSGAKAKGMVKIGDVIYINSLRIGFDSWKDQNDYDSKSFAISILKQLLLDMKYSNMDTTKELSNDTLNAAIRAAYIKNTEDNSDYDKEQILEGTIAIIKKIMAVNLTQAQISSQIKTLDLNLDAIDNHVTEVEKSIKLYSTSGKKIQPNSPNFHVVSVLDIHDGKIKISQIDGSQPLQAMSIDYWSNRINDTDRVAILRNK